MRDDMNKVVIERPRRGGAGKGGVRRTYNRKTSPKERRTFKGVDVDLRPKRESIRRKHIVNGFPKEFSDLLGPLEGYLLSRVGQPWDNVWSDICKVLKGNSLQAAHIKGHVKQMVGGIPHSGETYFLDEDWFSPGYRYGISVYVNEEGILCKSEEKKYKYKQETYHYYRESDTVEYHKLNGAWFRVEIGSEEKDIQYKGIYRTFTRRETLYFPLSKRTLSKKEIKKMELEKKTETISPKVTLKK